MSDNTENTAPHSISIDIVLKHFSSEHISYIPSNKKRKEPECKNEKNKSFIALPHYSQCCMCKRHLGLRTDTSGHSNYWGQYMLIKLKEEFPMIKVFIIMLQFRVLKGIVETATGISANQWAFQSSCVLLP